MRDDLIRDIFRFLGEKSGFIVGRAAPEIERRIEELSLELDVKRLLQWSWPDRYAMVGPYQLQPVDEILENEDLARLLNARMVPIGTARNGDILVILSTNRDHAEVGLVSHDELWEETSTPEEAYVRVTATFEEYLYRAAEKRYLPIDSFAASELSSLAQQLKGDERT